MINYYAHGSCLAHVSALLFILLLTTLSVNETTSTAGRIYKLEQYCSLCLTSLAVVFNVNLFISLNDDFTVYGHINTNLVFFLRANDAFRFNHKKLYTNFAYLLLLLCYLCYIFFWIIYPVFFFIFTL